MSSRHPLSPQRRHLRPEQEQGGVLMRRQQVASRNGLQSVTEVANRRQSPRPSIEFGLMYSAQDHCGEVLMGDGMVTDLSPVRIGYSRQRLGQAGDGPHDLSLPPRWTRPTVYNGSDGGLGFRTSVWSRDPQDEPTGTKPALVLLALESRIFRLDCSPATTRTNDRTTADRQTSVGSSPSSSHCPQGGPTDPCADHGSLFSSR